MSGVRFDWDDLFLNSKWSYIYNNSPFFNGQRLPSLVNRDSGLIYLSSLDVDLSIYDTEGLVSIVQSINISFKSNLNNKNYYKAAVAQADFHAVKDLLFDLGVQIPDLTEG